MLTGATGFIGSHLADNILARGASLNLWVRRKTPLISGFEARGAAVFIRPGEDLEALRASLAGVDTVIHCAGATRALTEADYIRANVDLTTSLLGLMASRQRLIFISSQAAAGPSDDGRPLKEDTVPRPITHYGKSKLQAERRITQWGALNANNYVILRPCTVYGAREKDLFAFFKLIASGVMPCVAKGTQSISLVHMDDLVQAVMLAATCSHPGELFFVADHAAYGWNEVCDCIRKALGKKRVLKLNIPLACLEGLAWAAEAVSRLRRKPGTLDRQRVLELRQPFWLCGSHKIRERLKWRQTVGLESGIRRTADWYRQAGWL